MVGLKGSKRSHTIVAGSAPAAAGSVLLLMGCQAIAGIEDMQYVPESPGIDASQDLGQPDSTAQDHAVVPETGHPDQTSEVAAPDQFAPDAPSEQQQPEAQPDGATCSAVDSCPSSQYCSSGGSCAPVKTIGAACDPATECWGGGGCQVCGGSASCVDGHCCSSPQCNPCERCGSDGNCQASVFNNIDPGKCDNGHQCDTQGQCKTATGASCNNSGDCLGGNFCLDNVCCGSASCPQCHNCGSDGSCSIQLTGAPDTSGDTCDQTSSCDANGICKLALGQTCTGGSACLFGYCVDNVCCDTSGTQCTGCKVCGSTGHCGVAADADPHSFCPAPFNCTVSGACAVACYCESQDSQARCDNKEHAIPNNVPYYTGNCKFGYFCKNNQCVPKLGGGQTCGYNWMCASDNCNTGMCMS